MASRQDALRHLRAFQCPQCGRKFGVSYKLKRHMHGKKQCMKSVGTSMNPINPEKVNHELAEAIAKLQQAKGEDIYPAIKHCLEYYSTC